MSISEKLAMTIIFWTLVSAAFCALLVMINKGPRVR